MGWNRGSPISINPEEEKLCIEVLKNKNLSIRKCLAVLQNDIPHLTLSSLRRVIDRDRRRNNILADARPKYSYYDHNIRKYVVLISRKKLNYSVEISKSRGRPRKYTDAQEAEIKGLLKQYGSVPAAKEEIRRLYPTIGLTKIREISRKEAPTIARAKQS